ncbi:hypothetical protein CPter91_2373 [Collimonas pratensis]|uniref:Uncharacterized protein n=1 Tax=Collimonas pratensis TaxID=279113 RepID=A0A127Q4I3_9BURK|nr:hypothetical protein CPter91_2373 [Collimonas pratensis]
MNEITSIWSKFLQQQTLTALPAAAATQPSFFARCLNWA